MAKCEYCHEPILVDGVMMGNYFLHTDCEKQINTLNCKIEFLAACCGLDINDPRAKVFRAMVNLAVSDYDMVLETVNWIIDESGENFADWAVTGGGLNGVA